MSVTMNAFTFIDTVLMVCDSVWCMCSSMTDHEGVAEMLIDSLGTTIVNTTDSKGR